MFTLKQKVKPHPEVVDTELDDQETVLLHLESKTYYSLNPTGSYIWKQLKNAPPLEQISERLQQDFKLDPQRAATSLLKLIDELARQQLVQAIDEV